MTAVKTKNPGSERTAAKWWGICQPGSSHIL